MIYNIYIFNRRGNCLYYREYSRPFHSLKDDPEEDKRLVFGMLFSMKDLTSKLNPGSAKDNLKVIRAGSFNLHHFQSATGVMIVMNTDNNVSDVQAQLQHIYSQIYIDNVVHNPLVVYRPDVAITSPLFISRLEDYMKSLPFFK